MQATGAERDNSLLDKGVARLFGVRELCRERFHRCVAGPNRHSYKARDQRRGAGAVDRGGLENRCTPRGYPGFESLPLRQIATPPSGPARRGPGRGRIGPREGQEHVRSLRAIRYRRERWLTGASRPAQVRRTDHRTRSGADRHREPAPRHPLCWVHAERLGRKVDPFTNATAGAQADLEPVSWWRAGDMIGGDGDRAYFLGRAGSVISLFEAQRRSATQAMVAWPSNHPGTGSAAIERFVHPALHHR
jgi:hypothetical protein